MMASLSEVERASLMAISYQLGIDLLLHLSQEAQDLADFLIQMIEADYISYSTKLDSSTRSIAASDPYLAVVPALKDLYSLNLGCPPTLGTFNHRTTISLSLKKLIFDPARELGLPYALVVTKLWQYWSFLGPDLIYQGCLPRLRTYYTTDELANKLDTDSILVQTVLSPVLPVKKQELCAAIDTAWRDLLPGRRRKAMDITLSVPADTTKKHESSVKRRERRIRQRQREDRERDRQVVEFVLQRERRGAEPRGEWRLDRVFFSLVVVLAIVRCFTLPVGWPRDLVGRRLVESNHERTEGQASTTTTAPELSGPSPAHDVHVTCRDKPSDQRQEPDKSLQCGETIPMSWPASFEFEDVPNLTGRSS